MNRKHKDGFTLVELVVVITILAILSTLGFVAYVDYLKSVRDSSRIQQMTGLYDAMVLFGTKTRIPISNNNGVSILAGSGTIGFQGDIDQNMRDAIKYSDGGVDPKTKENYTYFVSSDRKYIQILGYFEENNAIELGLGKSIYANDIDYSSLYPRVTGDNLGVIIENNTQIPIQNFEENFDILSSVGDYKSIITTNNILIGSGTDLVGMIPGSSCKSILNTLGSAESKVYKINPDGTGQFDVYCDMETDGGGWTFGVYVSGDASSLDVYFNARTGVYDANRNPSENTYSIDISQLYHTEMLFLFDESDITTADTNNNLLRFKYDLFTPGFYMGPLIVPNGSTFFGGVGDDGLSYATSISGNMIPTNRDRHGAGGWGFGSHSPDFPFLLKINESNNGVLRYDEVWGGSNGSSTGHTGYIYVR